MYVLAELQERQKTEARQNDAAALHTSLPISALKASVPCHVSTI